jgi:phage terminase small subunit
MTEKKGKKGARKARTPTLRQRLKDEGVLQGKSLRQAALDAGYAPSTANSNIYKEQEKARTQTRIDVRIKEAQIDTNEVIGTLVSHMRADLADICPKDAFLKAARENGVSHLIKELEISERVIKGESLTEGDERAEDVLERKYKIKVHDAQSAAKQLSVLASTTAIKSGAIWRISSPSRGHIAM